MHAVLPNGVLVVPASMLLPTPATAIDDDDNNNDDDDDDDNDDDDDRDNSSDSSRYRTSSNGSSSSTPQYRRVDITPTAPSTEAGKGGGEVTLAIAADVGAAALYPDSTTISFDIAMSTFTATDDAFGAAVCSVDVLAKAAATSNLQYCAGNDRYGSATPVAAVEVSAGVELAVAEASLLLYWFLFEAAVEVQQTPLEAVRPVSFIPLPLESVTTHSMLSSAPAGNCELRNSWYNEPFLI
jgi:hypothetical protein